MMGGDRTSGCPPSTGNTTDWAPSQGPRPKSKTPKCLRLIGVTRESPDATGGDYQLLCSAAVGPNPRGQTSNGCTPSEEGGMPPPPPPTKGTIVGTNRNLPLGKSDGANFGTHIFGSQDPLPPAPFLPPVPLRPCPSSRGVQSRILRATLKVFTNLMPDNDPYPPPPCTTTSQGPASRHCLSPSVVWSLRWIRRNACGSPPGDSEGLPPPPKGSLMRTLQPNHLRPQGNPPPPPPRERYSCGACGAQFK